MAHQSCVQFLISLQPALPFGSNKKPMTGGELRRLMADKAVLINTEPVTPSELIDFPVFSIVFFPSGKRRTTIV